MSERGRIFQPLEKASAVRSPRRESPRPQPERPRNGELGPGIPLFLSSPDPDSAETTPSPRPTRDEPEEVRQP